MYKFKKTKGCKFFIIQIKPRVRPGIKAKYHFEIKIYPLWKETTVNHKNKNLFYPSHFGENGGFRKHRFL